MLRNLIGILLLAGMIACHSKGDNTYRQVTKNYTSDEINLFYELCFNEKDTLYKWDRNISFYIEGDTLSGDRAMILDVVSTLNSLKLPIKIVEVNKKINCNLIIRSATEKDLALQKPNRAVTHLYNTANRIDSAEIGLSNTLHKSKRKVFLLHEFLHTMGFTSHVTTNSKRILFSFRDTTEILNEKEKKALKILYEPVWNELFLKKDFEKIFSSLLHEVNRKEKVLQFVRVNSVSKNILQEILRHGLIKFDSLKEPQIVKHINPLKIILKGTVPIKVKEGLPLIINEINSATPNLNLKISHDSTLQYGVFINFILNDTVPNDHISVNFKNILIKKAVFPTIIRSDISIYYNKEYNNAKSSIGPVIYQAVTLKDYNYPVEPFEYVDDKLKLKQFYKQLLKVYYAPEFPYNLSKSELNEVITSIR